MTQAKHPTARVGERDVSQRGGVWEVRSTGVRVVVRSDFALKMPGDVVMQLAADRENFERDARTETPIAPVVAK